MPMQSGLIYKLPYLKRSSFYMYVLSYSKTFTASDVVSYYHGLWQIEEYFRISKHCLRVRPILIGHPKE